MPAEPARPGRDHAGTTDAAVIRFRRPFLCHRRKDATTQPPAVSDDPSPQQRLAERIEAMFLREHLTLTDPDAAAAYRVTVNAVLLLCDGAFQQGLVEEEQHREMHAMIKGLLDVPRLV